MARRVVAMEVRLMAAAARSAAGERVHVTGLCRELGISRQTFYKWRRRYAVEGPVGLLERSRRPLTSPGRTPGWMEDEIARARKELAGEGWDAGALSIAERLRRRGLSPPAASTVHRVLRRRGLVEDAPAKRPRSAWRRFEYPRTNDCWQIDGTEVELADGSKAEVVGVIDDCSRRSLGSVAARAETAEAAWAAVLAAICAHGLPAMLLSDNSKAFNCSRRGARAALEDNLVALGVLPVASSPYHPQTCGKRERAHGTLKRWLRARPAPADLAALQALLDEFDAAYNDRPHQGLAMATPNERWAERERGGPPAAPGPEPKDLRMTTATVSARGSVAMSGKEVQLGSQWAGLTVTCATDGLRGAVFHGHTLIRQLDLDPDRRYQPNGQPRGGRRKPRVTSEPIR